MQGNITRQITIGIQPESVTFDGKNIWCLEQQPQNYLNMYDYNGKLIKALTLSFNSMYICWDGANIWVLTRLPNHLHQIDFEGNIIRTINQPLSTAKGITFDGKSFWVIDDVAYVYQVDFSGNVIFTSELVDAIPYGLDFAGRFFWSGDDDIPGIGQFDWDGIRLGDYPLSFLPDDIVYDGKNMICVNGASNEIIFLE